MSPQPRVFALLCALSAIAACGDGGDTDTDGTSAVCPYTGTADGCLIYESTDCSTDNSYGAVDGGWYELRDDGSMLVQLAPNDAGMQIGFEILDASGIAATPAEYEIPTQVILHLVDSTGEELQSCAGKVTITQYTEGGILWGQWAFQAKTITGVCGEVEYYASQGEFINVEPCGG